MNDKDYIPFAESGLAYKQPEPYDYRPQWARGGLALPIATRPRIKSRSDDYRCPDDRGNDK